MEYRISVLMGIYNCAPTLKEALDSLLAQTYQGFKVIMCDDGSKDNTYEVAKSYADKYENFILIKNEKNMGLNYTLNHCLEYADTEYIARMDGDDLCMPDRFETELRFLEEHPEYAIVSSPMEYFDEKGTFMTGKGRGEIKPEHFRNGSPICHAPCLVRKEAYDKVGGYSVSPKLLRVEDYNLWFKMYAAGYKAFMLDKPYYRMRDDRNAKNRRKWSGRKNEYYVMSTGFKMLGLPWYYQLYALRPLIIGLLPGWLYDFLHKRK